MLTPDSDGMLTGLLKLSSILSSFPLKSVSFVNEESIEGGVESIVNTASLESLPVFCTTSEAFILTLTDEEPIEGTSHEYVPEFGSSPATKIHEEPAEYSIVTLFVAIPVASVAGVHVIENNEPPASISPPFGAVRVIAGPALSSANWSEVEFELPTLSRTVTLTVPFPLSDESMV